MNNRYTEVAFPTAVRKLFTYEIPSSLRVEAGMRVLAPLRSGEAIGMVVKVHSIKPRFRTKPIRKVLDTEPLLDQTLLRLTEWIHRFYYCSWGEVLQAALPAGQDLQTGRNVSRPATLHWFWQDGTNSDDVKRVVESEGAFKWVSALKRLLELDLPIEQRELISVYGISRHALLRIEQEGLIRSEERVPEVEEISPGLYEPEQISSLSGEQQGVFDQIEPSLSERVYRSFLLYGVTGSGKTEIYIHALQRVLEKGRGGMVLVPEIALTPQTVKRFYRIFGDQVAVLHSRLSDADRLEAWKNLRSGQKRIVIGPRSAVFAPLQNPGLIVVDEEHDVSYKQFDPAPRYHARDVAVMRATLDASVVIMGSATPSLGSLQAAKRGKHRLLRLPSRPVGEMPQVKVLDLKQYRGAMKGPVTASLHAAVTGALERGEQVILLYNRRGYASYLICEACGHIPKGPGSSVSLTWHRKKNLLRCHYTGYSRRTDRYCEECGSEELTAMGSGTQQIEEQLEKLFPDARILRMDRDTTSGRDAHREIYEQFGSGRADILIGTQLVAKGLDFPGVTVVGVLQAETELAFPSWRAGERMFQLLSQVAGRAGRSAAGGVVYIETWKPDHRSIRFAQVHDFNSFAKEELEDRKNLTYPPFSRLVTFHFKGLVEAKTIEVAEAFSEALRMECPDPSVLGPSPSVIERIGGRWHWVTSLKISPSRNELEIEELLNRIFERFEKRKPKGAGSVRIAVDVDAVE